ncbi:MAG: SDR family oxidoreductase [Candidatus Omnitrophota bacterium]
MKTILVTGRNGFIGRSLVKILKNRHQVVSVVRRSDPSVDYAGEEVIVADLVKVQAGDVRGLQIDVAVHLAASVRGSGPAIEKNNIESSRALFRLCEQLNIPVLFLSSANSIFFQELGSYAYSKKVCEDILRNSPLRYLIVRVPWVIAAQSPLARSARGFYKKFGFFPLLGKGLGQTQPVEISAFAQTLAGMIDRGEFARRVVHIAGKESYTYRSILEHLLENKKTRFLTVPFQPALSVVRFLEKLRIPFLVSSEEIKSMNIDKRIGPEHGEAVFLENSKEVLF